MTTRPKQSWPRYLLNVTVGIALGCVISVLVPTLINLTPFFGEEIAAPYLFVPDQMGLVKRLDRAEVSTVTVSTSQDQTIWIGEPGQHRICTIHPWVVGGVILTHQKTGWEIQASPIYDEEAGGCRTTVVKPLFDACAGWYETAEV